MHKSLGCASDRRQERVALYTGRYEGTWFFGGSHSTLSGVWSQHMRWQVVDNGDSSGLVAIQVP